MEITQTNQLQNRNLKPTKTFLEYKTKYKDKYKLKKLQQK